ncbi:acid phosphatase [Ophiobolus disseminans]|uniref:Phytase A n=1 Tax=Ophiobolus disseminans TaxID=1469910 RepID=A0A6A7A3K4_9PLEO|nr:acid phosphatase [Ophiobolus disseminans]
MMITRTWNRLRGDRSQEYTLLPLSEKVPSSPRKTRHTRWALWSIVGLTLFTLYGLVGSFASSTSKSCDTIDDGYRCSPKTSHFWGQYSLWYSVPSEMDVVPRKRCKVTFANVLSRHGGRDPTLGKSMAYALLIADIQNTSTDFPGEFAFLKHYRYALGADELTNAGRQEMVNSGANFFRRYHKLLKKHIPFVRAGGQHRVIESAQKWLLGIAQSTKALPKEIDLIIPEGAQWNNTLSHDNCPAFEGGPSHGLGDRAQHIWAAKFVPPIQDRINSALGTNLSTTSIVYLMDMCPFDTLAHPTAKMSDFCRLFTNKEWHAYDYFQTLGKYYGYSVGNPLGATQGVGYVNELLARLTEKPVNDSTNTNSTLNSDPKTFPLGRRVYADFSHDNDISGVLAALGLYNSTKALSNTTIESTEDTHGYSAAWTVPFASRMYVEKLQCKHEEEEFVRIIVNDRVQPLEFCGGDRHGRCKLSSFVESQSFARHGGLWNQCHAEDDSSTPFAVPQV